MNSIEAAFRAKHPCTTRSWAMAVWIGQLAMAAVVAVLAMPFAGFAQAGEVSVCVDPEPPPSAYWLRDARGARTQELTGSSVELVRAAFDALGLKVRFIADLPWVRCLQGVTDGEIDFAMNAYHDEQRARRLSYSVRYQSLTPQVFYTRSRPIQVSGVADLQKYRGCGMIGASYAHYGLAPEALDLGVNSYARLIEKLKAGRCDYFVEELEVIAALKFTGADPLVDPEIVNRPVPGARAPARHLVALRGGAAAARLPQIDRALTQLVASGQAARFWRRHAGDLPYAP